MNTLYGLLRDPLVELLLPVLLGDLDELLGAEYELPDPCRLLLLLVFRLELLDAAPDGSLMVPRELDEGAVPADVPVAPWSLLPLQPTNNAAALANANSFFIMVMVTFLLQTVSSAMPLLNR